MQARKFIAVHMGEFAHDRRGSFLIIFAFMLMPLITLLGAGLDYSRMAKAKSQIAATLDAAMLAAQQQYSLDDSVDYEKIITDYVAQNLKQGEKPIFFSDIAVSNIVLSETGEMSADISADVPLHFLALTGQSETTVRAHSAAMVGGSSIEVALVLDNTGSMQGDKIASLKTSAANLVDAIMTDEGDNEKVKIAVVPFADYVNIGMENRGEEGLDIPDDYDYQPPGENCDVSYPNSTYKCECVPGYKETCNDGKCETKWNNCATQTCSGSKGDPVYSNCKYKPVQKYSWYGCMASRPYTPSKLNTTDDSYDSQGVPGVMDTSDWCKNIAPVQRLTTNKGEVTAALNRMKSQRYTYIPSGLIWGWRSLSNEAPFTEGVPSSNNGVKKVVVLMTDGENTKSASKKTGAAVQNHEGVVYWHGGSSTSTANTVTSELCENIKDAGIMLYTISFDVDGDGGDSIRTLMQNCAGNGGQYYDAADSTKLEDAFRKIGLALLNLRLSK